MKRWLAVAVVAAMLAVPAASATGWLQPRGDAAATGFQPEEGPDWPNVALDVPLPDRFPSGDPPGPLILEDRILVMTNRLGDEAGRGELLSVDRSTANVTTIAEFPWDPTGTMATDGETVYVTNHETIRAFPLESSGDRWNWTWQGATSGPEVGDDEPRSAQIESCPWMRLDDGHLTVLCGLERAETIVFPGNVQDKVLVARVDAGSGETEWIWQPPQTPDADEGDKRAPSFPRGLAVSGPRVVVQTTEAANTGPGDLAQGGQKQIELWGLVKETEDASGELAWTWSSPPVNQTKVCASQCVSFEERDYFGNPAASDTAVYAKAKQLHKFNLGSGEELWSRSIGDEDFDGELFGGNDVAVGNGHVYTTTTQTVYRFGQEDPDEGWTRSLDVSREQGFSENPIVTPSTVYTVALPTETRGEVVHAFDTEDGSIEWTHEVPHNFLKFAVGDGLFVYTDQGNSGEGIPASLVVLGRTEASPGPALDISSRYPAPGEPVRVNLSGSEAGLQGPVTQYKAIWGDGNETAWQEEPVLNHSYAEAGNRTARFVVGNDAGQTNSTTVAFHVGQEEPTEPNAVETAFKKENQDMTFGVLGVALALGGGFIGVARRKRKKTVLQQELEALEQGFEDTRDQPTECEAFLDNRKARARSLALDGKLDEEQVTVIENRAEELRSKLRADALEEEFGFLPHSLVVKARQMVEDGKVTSLERDAFLRAVEEDEMLTSQQKANVRERIEAWFARDAGGGRSSGGEGSHDV